MKHLVHINRHHLAANRRDGGDRPIYSVHRGRGGKPVYGRSVIMRGVVTLAGPSAATPLRCGATVWCEVEGDVEVVDPVAFADVDAKLSA